MALTGIVSPKPSLAVVEDVRKPTHDARLHYYKVLEYVMLSSKVASISGQYMVWFSALRQFYAMVLPYTKHSRLNGMRDRLLAVQKTIMSLGVQSRFRDQAMTASVASRSMELDNLLFGIETDLHIASKDMMLPTGTVDETILDDEKFLRASDL
jgi:hypothetical protein